MFTRQQASHYSSVGRAGDCNVIVIPRSLVRIQLVRHANILVEWPSGLRRQVKALISSEARVRIPSQPMQKTTIIIYYDGAHLAQKVERWPFKPMVVGSIPTVGAGQKNIFLPYQNWWWL